MLYTAKEALLEEYVCDFSFGSVRYPRIARSYYWLNDKVDRRSSICSDKIVFMSLMRAFPIASLDHAISKHFDCWKQSSAYICIGSPLPTSMMAPTPLAPSFALCIRAGSQFDASQGCVRACSAVYRYSIL